MLSSSPTPDPQHMMKAFVTQNESDILASLYAFKAQYGLPVLVSLSQRAKIPFTHKNIQCHASLLAIAQMRNFQQVAACLLAWGVSPNDGITAADNPTTCIETPLMLACYTNNEAWINLILNYHPNLLLQNHARQTALMMVQSIDACHQILQEAHRQGNLMALVRLKDSRNFTAFDCHCLEGRPHIVQRLLQLGQRYFPINIQQLLHEARHASLYYPDMFKAFHEICLTVRPLAQRTRGVVTFDFQPTNNLSNPYRDFFGKSVPTQPPSTKTEAIERAIAQIAALFNSPVRCIPYLKKINDELERYYRETHGSAFPLTDRSTIQFYTIDDVEFPIPLNTFKATKKNSALQEYLVLLFGKHHFYACAYKWIGFISDSVANNMMSRGDFSVECRFDTGLFHHKIAHMMQRALILLAMEKGEIQTGYVENNEPKTLTLLDLLPTIVQHKCMQNPKMTLWHELFDMHFHKRVSFSDPFRLGSFIIKEGPAFGLTTLSDYLLNTFCQGYRKQLQAFNDKTHQTVSASEYAEIMNDRQIYTFIGSPFLTQYSLEREANRVDDKNKLVIATTQYGIVQKRYTPNRKFQLR